MKHCDYCDGSGIMDSVEYSSHLSATIRCNKCNGKGYKPSTRKERQAFTRSLPKCFNCKNILSVELQDEGADECQKCRSWRLSNESSNA